MGDARWLIDTDVVSETARTAPDPAVVAWLARQDRFRLSAITVFELARGIERLRPGRRRTFLESWLGALLGGPAEVVPFGATAALVAARIEAGARPLGRSVDLRDLLILATAQAGGLGVATRNVRHFRGAGVPVVDPASGTGAY